MVNFFGTREVTKAAVITKMMEIMMMLAMRKQKRKAHTKRVYPQRG